MCMLCILYDSSAGAITGFTNIGEINSYLSAYENDLKETKPLLEPLAKSMLVIMVRGLFSPLKFPYAQFPCTDLSGWFTPKFNVHDSLM